MPRISRKSFKGQQVFHVMTQGIKKENIFKDERKKYEYIKLAKETRDEYNIKLIAYCIMNNHAHILLNTAEINNMTNFMHKINTSYGLYYNKNLDRVGYVFRNRFETQPISDINYLYNCILYIHNNPVKAGICNHAKKYKFSSYFNFYKENKKIFNRMFKNFQEYELAHSSSIQKINFLEDEDDIEKEVKDEITAYLTVTKKSKLDLKDDKELLKPIAKKLKIVYGLSNRRIGQHLNVSGEKIRYILK